jgi:hypothetical protein
MFDVLLGILLAIVVIVGICYLVWNRAAFLTYLKVLGMAIVIGLIVFLVCFVLGEVLSRINSSALAFLGIILKTYAHWIGTVAGVWHFFTRL